MGVFVDDIEALAHHGVVFCAICSMMPPGSSGETLSQPSSMFVDVLVIEANYFVNQPWLAVGYFDLGTKSSRMGIMGFEGIDKTWRELSHRFTNDYRRGMLPQNKDWWRTLEYGGGG